ncbi:MAG: UDP-N-acetylglucosamine 2-epimerase [Phycisphaerae bacterium]|nr:UDP-N-acetylglucosamine 2-epimerase [Phycisphaerae bacterium]
MRSICIYTATRAEYGLLRPLMRELSQTGDVRLQILASGTHLSPEFGLTYREIEADGFTIDEKVEMLTSSDTHQGICQSMGLAMAGYGAALQRLQPDILVLLGDRYETFCMAAAAQVSRIPVAHLHGGEASEGVMDEAFRHSITKMSHLHFTATEPYRRRVIQLGENPERVWNVGAIGLANIRSLERPSKESLDFPLDAPYFLVTFHPVDEPGITPEEQFRLLLDAVDEFPECKVIFTKANADAAGRAINRMIDAYVAENPSRRAGYVALGVLRYLSAVQHAEAVIGNSSSGILEVPALHTPVVNIGSRQRGRIRPAGVLDCDLDRRQIVEAIRKAMTPDFRAGLAGVDNPYEKPDTVENIVRHLKQADLDGLLKKSFYSLPENTQETP